MPYHQQRYACPLRHRRQPQHVVYDIGFCLQKRRSAQLDELESLYYRWHLPLNANGSFEEALSRVPRAL